LALRIAPSLIPARHLFAEGLSTLAVVLMSTNLVLSTRARPLERWLRGLDKVFVTHRTIGLTVAVLVLSHFTLVLKSVGYVPSKPLGYTTLALVVGAVFSASAPRYPWRRLVPLRYETWKATHRTMGAVVALGITHSWLAHPYVRTVPLLTAYVYGVAAVGLAAWVYREFVFSRTGAFRDYRIGRFEVLRGEIAEVTLAESSGLARAAGQFVFASFEAGPTREQHPFTVSSGPRSEVRLSIKASGDFTRELLAGVPEGTSVRIEGPYGAFDRRRGGPRQVWLAGGIGITPFLAMAADLDAETDVLLVWSVRTAEEAVYRRRLEDAARTAPGLEFRLHQTSALGHVRIGALGPDGWVRERSYFICGPVPMRLDLLRQLKELGVPRSRVFFEEFRLR